eukprot:CFRG2435T1
MQDSEINSIGIFNRRASTSILDCMMCNRLKENIADGRESDDDETSNRGAQRHTTPPTTRTNHKAKLCHIHSTPSGDGHMNVRRVRSITGFMSQRVNYVTSKHIAQNFSIEDNTEEEIASPKYKINASSSQQLYMSHQLPCNRLSTLHQDTTILGNSNTGCVIDREGQEAGMSSMIKNNNLLNDSRTPSKRLSKALCRELALSEDEKGPLWYTLSSLLTCMRGSEYCPLFVEISGVSVRALRGVRGSTRGTRTRTGAFGSENVEEDVGVSMNMHMRECEGAGSLEDDEWRGVVSESVYKNQLLHTPSTKLRDIRSRRSHSYGKPNISHARSCKLSHRRQASLPQTPTSAPIHKHAHMHRTTVSVDAFSPVQTKKLEMQEKQTSLDAEVLFKYNSFDADRCDEYVTKNDTTFLHKGTTLPYAHANANTPSASNHKVSLDRGVRMAKISERSAVCKKRTGDSLDACTNPHANTNEKFARTMEQTASEVTRAHRDVHLNGRSTDVYMGNGVQEDNNDASDCTGDGPVRTIRYLALIVNKAARDETAVFVVRPNTDQHTKSKNGRRVRLSVVMPVWTGTTLSLHGDGTLRLKSVLNEYEFRMPSVRSLWSTHGALAKAISNAERHNYYPGGPSHEFLKWYVHYGRSNELPIPNRDMKRSEDYVRRRVFNSDVGAGDRVVESFHEIAGENVKVQAKGIPERCWEERDADSGISKKTPGKSTMALKSDEVALMKTAALESNSAVFTPLPASLRRTSIPGYLGSLNKGAMAGMREGEEGSEGVEDGTMDLDINDRGMRSVNTNNMIISDEESYLPITCVSEDNTLFTMCTGNNEKICADVDVVQSENETVCETSLDDICSGSMNLDNTECEEIEEKLMHPRNGVGHSVNDAIVKKSVDDDRQVSETMRTVSKERIDVALHNIMLNADLDELTCGEVRRELEVQFEQDLRSYKKYIDERMMVVLGQMEHSSEIFNEFLYLGTEWNASNMEELIENKVGFVLNMAIEIDNFYPDTFRYCHIRVWDEAEADIYPFLDEAVDFIKEAKQTKSRVLVHCQMGVSRSATAVIAYCLRELEWNLDESIEYVHSRRNVVNPNKGFRKQLIRYEKKCINRRREPTFVR